MTKILTFGRDKRGRAAQAEMSFDPVAREAKFTPIPPVVFAEDNNPLTMLELQGPNRLFTLGDGDAVLAMDVVRTTEMGAGLMCVGAGWRDLGWPYIEEGGRDVGYYPVLVQKLAGGLKYLCEQGIGAVVVDWKEVMRLVPPMVAKDCVRDWKPCTSPTKT